MFIFQEQFIARTTFQALGGAQLKIKFQICKPGLSWNVGSCVGCVPVSVTESGNPVW